MMACEQGSFDVTTAMAGHLGRPSIVAAHSAMINVIGLTFVSLQPALVGWRGVTAVASEAGGAGGRLSGAASLSGRRSCG